jgi:thiosulfate dehydrogenase
MERSLARRLVAAVAIASLMGAATLYGWQAEAHGAKHTDQQLKLFQDQFMEQVKIGDALWHGNPALEKEMGVKLSNTGTACAMCHPFASDVHPHQFPKWQEQIGGFATLRDMINWCIAKPNQGEEIDVSSPAMKALEAYATWSSRGTPLQAGTH